MKCTGLALRFTATSAARALLKMSWRNIPGIGKNTATQLLKIFKSVKKVKDTPLEELQSALGKSKGALVLRLFSPAGRMISYNVFFDVLPSKERA